MKRDLLGLLGWLLVSAAVAAAGGLATASSVNDWYPGLAKPGWTPPDAVFGPVWTVLYTVMGLSAWLVWLRRSQPGARAALRVYVAHLGLNLAWSVLFFGLRSPWAGLAGIALLLLALGETIRRFLAVRPLAGLLLLPYLAWVSFAAALNLAIALAN